jgi:tRNA (cmo5U34)-methyltransferase
VDDRIWQDEQVAHLFANTTRASIPMASEQIVVMRHLIRSLVPGFQTVMDLGCGDGILGQAMLELNPAAAAAFVDFSPPLLEMARKRMQGRPKKTEFLPLDYGKPGWTKSLGNAKAFDLVISGFSIHHQPDSRKREIYAEIFGLLSPGGLFLNLEHVMPGSPRLTELSDALFIDALYAREKETGGGKSRDDLARDHLKRPDKDANILAPVDLQCSWLREIGYRHVDCYFKILELALFGGQKPDAGAGADTGSVRTK